MKKSVSELQGAELDYWVARAEGRTLVEARRFDHPQELMWTIVMLENSRSGAYFVDWSVSTYWDFCLWKAQNKLYVREHDGYSPSENWSQGGPVLGRERIVVVGDWVDKEKFHAFRPQYFEHVHCAPDGVGSTYLEAGMRCRVALKFGDAVEYEVPGV